MKKGLFFVVVGIILFVGFGLYLQGMETRDEKEVDAYFLKFDKESKPIEITPEGFRLSNFFNDVIREHSEDFIMEFADTLTGETKKKAEIYISEYLKVFGRKRKMKEEDLKTFVKLLDALAKKPDDLKQLIEDLEIEELITQIWMADCFGVEAFLDKLLAQYAKKIKPKIKKEDYCNFFLSKQSIFSKIEEDLPPDVVKYSLPQKLFYGYDVIEFVEPIKTGSDVRRMVVLPNGNFISGHEDGTIRIWNSKTGEQIGKPIKTGSSVESMVVLPNGNFISGHEGGTIRIWNSKTGEQIGKTIKTDSWFDLIVALPNGNFISGHEDGTIRIWNSKTGEQIGKPIKTGSSVDSIVALPNKNFISDHPEDGTIRIWNSKTGEQIGKTIKTDSWVDSIVALPNKNFISGHEDGTIRIWNSKTGEQIGKTIKTDFWVNSIVALPNKNFISSYVDRTIRIWNSKTGEQIGKPIKIGSLVDSMVVLPNGNFISGHEDGTIQIWNLNLYKGLTFKEAVLLRLLMKRRKEGIQIQSKVKESAKYKEASLGLSKKKIFQSFFGEIDTEDFDDDDEKEVQMEEDEEIVFES